MNRRAVSGLAAIATLTAATVAVAQAPSSPPAAAAPAAIVPAAGEAPPPSRWDYAIVPIPFYAPETSLGLAVGVGLFEDTPTQPDRPRRDDSVSLLVQGTLRKQVVVQLSGVKFWKAARYQLTADGSLMRFPNYFWGVGNATPDAARELTAQSLGVFRSSFATRIFEEVYLGEGLTVGAYDVGAGAPGGAVASYTGAHPAQGHVFGGGPVLRRDTRDDALGPHRGSWTSLSATFFNAGFGSSYSYQQYELDHRAFIALGSRSVLALEAYGAYAPGNVPLAELPALGGPSRLRGYYQGRFRDHLYLMGQVEWRVRVAGRFSVAPFAGVGNVFPGPSAISLDRTKVAAGGAIRFNLKKDRDLNVHIDVAKSPISSGVYLNMGEAF